MVSSSCEREERRQECRFISGCVGCGVVSAQAVADDPFCSDCSYCKISLIDLLTPNGLAWNESARATRQKEYRVPENVLAMDAALTRCDRGDHGTVVKADGISRCMTCGRSVAAPPTGRPEHRGASPWPDLSLAEPDPIAALTEGVRNLTAEVGALTEAIGALSSILRDRASGPTPDYPWAENGPQRGSEGAGWPSCALPVGSRVTVDGRDGVWRIVQCRPSFAILRSVSGPGVSAANWDLLTLID